MPPKKSVLSDSEEELSDNEVQEKTFVEVNDEDIIKDVDEEEDLSEEFSDDEEDDDDDIIETDEFIDKNDIVSQQIISDENRITRPVLSNKEKVQIISFRSQQLARGAKPLIDRKGINDLYKVAEKELEEKVLPFKIARDTYSGREIWKLSELELI